MKVKTGQYGKHIGLQECDDRLKPVHRSGYRKGRERGQDIEATQADGKATEHDKQRMAGHHVGEQPDRQRDRADDVRDQLDRHQEGDERDRQPGRHEERQETEAVLDDSDDGHPDKDHGRHRKGDDDVAGEREGLGDEPLHIREQDEHEERKNEREVGLAAVTGVVAHHVGDKLVRQLDNGLQPTGHHAAAAHPGCQQEDDRQRDDHHPQRGIGEGKVSTAGRNIDQRVNLELLERAFPSFCGVRRRDKKSHQSAFLFFRAVGRRCAAGSVVFGRSFSCLRDAIG